MLNTKITKVDGDEKVKGFYTDSGDLVSCDMIMYSVGIKPNIEILKDTDIKTNIGVIVNEKMETNIKDIYASGDIAEYNNHIYGLWNISIGHGKVAGSNIVGKEMIYEHIVPVTTLNAFGLSLFSMGIIEESEASNIIIEDKSEENIYNKILIKNNKVIGAIIIGNIRNSPILKTAIEKEIDLRGTDFNNVSFDELIETIKKRK